MAMTNLDKLKHFMKPYYQEVTDEVLLNEYLSQYTYPECAAAALWEELSGSAGMVTDALNEIDTGGEKIKYFSPETMQKTCLANAKMYQQRCNDIKGVGGCAISVMRSTVAGSINW